MGNITNYLTFILGYDLLEDILKKDTDIECNIAYFFCGHLVEQFLLKNNLTSKDPSKLYSLLDKWVDENLNQIVSEYEIYYNKQKSLEHFSICEERQSIKL